MSGSAPRAGLIKVFNPAKDENPHTATKQRVRKPQQRRCLRCAAGPLHCCAMGWDRKQKRWGGADGGWVSETQMRDRQPAPCWTTRNQTPPPPMYPLN